VRRVHKRLSAKEKAYLAKARVCRVGSVDRQGVPHVAPLCHAFDRERRTAYVATGGQTAENLRTRRRASIECDDYFENWDRLRGIVARTRARFISRGPELDRARALLYKKFEQYRKLEIDSVIALRVEKLTSWGL
jgi:nitroimidazol reductase NimA-like FMN-containing flavoprotein (pyridoxamine 5'-phosphate oxidase superfamily)